MWYCTATINDLTFCFIRIIQQKTKYYFIKNNLADLQGIENQVRMSRHWGLMKRKTHSIVKKPSDYSLKVFSFKWKFSHCVLKEKVK